MNYLHKFDDKTSFNKVYNTQNYPISITTYPFQITGNNEIQECEPLELTFARIVTFDIDNVYIYKDTNNLEYSWAGGILNPRLINAEETSLVVGKSLTFENGNCYKEPWVSVTNNSQVNYNHGNEECPILANVDTLKENNSNSIVYSLPITQTLSQENLDKYGFSVIWKGKKHVCGWPVCRKLPMIFDSLYYNKEDNNDSLVKGYVEPPTSYKSIDEIISNFSLNDYSGNLDILSDYIYNVSEYNFNNVLYLVTPTNVFPAFVKTDASGNLEFRWIDNHVLYFATLTPTGNRTYHDVCPGDRSALIGNVLPLIADKDDPEYAAEHGQASLEDCILVSPDFMFNGHDFDQQNSVLWITKFPYNGGLLNKCNVQALQQSQD